MEALYPRLSTPALSKALRRFPVVVLTGARQVGKTTLARTLRHNASYVSLDDPARAAEAHLAPATFLSSLVVPAVIDEIQYAPEVFRYLKQAVDRARRPGAYLVTGSQAFGLMAGVTESLAGRAAVFTLPALSLAEVHAQPSLTEIDGFLWRSGFPELWQRPGLDRDLWLGSYVATYLERDVRQVLQVGDLRDFGRFLRAAALRAGQLLSYADLARDVGIAPNTAKRWMSVLEASQQVFLLEPWHRQRHKRLIKAPKLYFNETGLLCHLMGFRSFDSLMAHSSWGAVWENFVVSEVRKRLMLTARPAPMWFWRTANGDEVDLLIETAPERFVAVECKTAEHPDTATARGLTKLVEEYGPAALAKGLIACRTSTSFTVTRTPPVRAVGVGELLETIAKV